MSCLPLPHRRAKTRQRFFFFYPCTSCCLPKRIQSREKICLLVFGEVQDTLNNWFMLNRSWSFIIPGISMKRPPHPAALFVNVPTVATDVLFSSTTWSTSWFICFRFHFPVIDLLMLSDLPVVLLWGGLPLVWPQERCFAPSPTSPLFPRCIKHPAPSSGVPYHHSRD